MITDYPGLKINQRTEFSKMYIDTYFHKFPYTNTIQEDYNACMKNSLSLFPTDLTNIQVISDELEEEHNIQNLFIPYSEGIDTFNDYEEMLTDNMLISTKSLFIPKNILKLHCKETLANSSIEYLYIPKNVEEISPRLLELSNIKELIIDANIKHIPYHLCADCEDLKFLKIISDIEVIEGGAFQFTGIKEITFPNTLKIIGPSSFYSSKIEKLVIDENIEEIGDYAFAATPLKEVTFKNIKNLKLGIQSFNSKEPCTVNVIASKEEARNFFIKNKNAFHPRIKINIIEKTLDDCIKENQDKDNIKESKANDLER